MRIILMASAALLVATTAFSVAAQASTQEQTFEDPTGDLRARLDSAVRSGLIDNRRSRLIGAQILQLERRYREYSSEGLTPGEMQTLRAGRENIIANLESESSGRTRDLLNDTDIFKPF